ncbi:Retrovirus-related Pol polyprotein from transposon RE1 [Vitis vinifera]|uniref:Retrovirus-related Pol polyprotein from transposon RE1 n=1 Tax=Vitis vinifera TaxID=29760 RepID=A0A438I8T4_VITVI|nr:Retrovirus-related Pol polyprotein from transposon RE1 [Vitis vinifera]
MENVVYANGFEDYIEGTKSCRPRSYPLGSQSRFCAMAPFDRMVLSWMYSTLNPDIMGQIVGFQTSHEAWMALHKIFSASSKARIMQLRLEFQTTKKGGDAMLDYILKMKTISDNLAAVGEPVKERDHILQLLGGLGPDYNSIVASLTAREDDLSLHSVHSILLTHEQRLHLQHSSPTDPSFASAHMASVPSRQPNRPHQPRHYHHPSRPQHQASSSSNRPPTRFHPQQPRNNHPIPSAHNKPHHLSTRPQCQLCGKFGHTAIKCYHRFDINYQGNNGVPLAQAPFSHAMLAAAPDHQDSWFFDTGATHHLSHSAQTLSCVQPYSGTDQVTIGDGNSLPILNTGTKSFFFPSKTFSLNQVLHVPHLSTNLISVSKFCTDNAVFFEFHSSCFFVKDQVTKKILLKGWLRDGLYEFSSSSPPRAFVTTGSFSDGAIWHSRLGHPAVPILSKALASCNPSVTLQINKIAPCIICPLAKSHSLPYSLSSSHASHPLALIHTDLWGPAPSTSITGARYFLILLMTIPGIPGFISFPPRTRLSNLLLPSARCFHVLIHLSKMEEQRGKLDILLKPVLLLWLKVSYPPNIGHMLFKQQYILLIFYQPNFSIFSHPLKPFFINFPTIIISESSVACVSHPYVLIHNINSAIATACVFLGYAPAHKGYLCLDVSTNRIYISRNLVCPSSPAVSSPIITSDSIPPLIPVPFATSSPAAPSPPPLPLNTHPMVTRAKSGIHKKRSFIVQHTTEPRTYSQASKNDSWVQAMNSEYQALLRNNTWSLVPPPSSAHIVGCRWIYKLKYRPDGSIDRHKARLVAQGFTQTPGIDYFDTFSPVVKPCTIRLILALAVSFQWTKFALRDLGPLSYFLGIQAQQLGSVLHLNQHKYIADLLNRTQMETSKPAPTPGRLGRTLSQSDGVSLSDPSEYRRTVGALQYVTLTRPDIAFAVNKACQFMAKPSDVHWMAVKRILRYLKGTIHLGLHFQPAASMELQGYSDADWASCPDDRRSTSGYCVFLGSNLISWSSSKQRLVSKSSAESEYRGLVSLTAELVWIQSYFKSSACLPLHLYYGVTTKVQLILLLIRSFTPVPNISN